MPLDERRRVWNCAGDHPRNELANDVSAGRCALIIPTREYCLLERIEDPAKDVLILSNLVVHAFNLDKLGVQPQEARRGSGAIARHLDIETPVFLRLELDRLFVVECDRDLRALLVDALDIGIAAPLCIVHVADADVTQSIGASGIAIEEAMFSVFTVRNLVDLEQEVERREDELARAAVGDTDPIHEPIFSAREWTSMLHLRHSYEVLGEASLILRSEDGLESHL